jgi:hypothetical protein
LLIITSRSIEQKAEELRELRFESRTSRSFYDWGNVASHSHCGISASDILGI